MKSNIIVLALGLTPLTGNAALTLMGNYQCTLPGNLVTNGSFENGSPGPGPNFAGQRLWANGTTQNFAPFEVPPGWTSSGNSNSYATWGNDDGNNTITGIRSSATFQDGMYGVYFGNGAAPTVDLSPMFNADGSVTFNGTPTFTMPVAFPTPVTLSQTVNTHLAPAPKYCLSFWISGEGAGLSAGNPLSDGIFGLQISNVLVGDPEMWFRVPSGSSSPDGASRYYMFELTPLDANQPVKITFKNYGHFNLTAHGRNGTTAELVLDDVRLVQIPESGTLTLAGLGVALLVCRRR